MNYPALAYWASVKDEEEQEQEQKSKSSKDVSCYFSLALDLDLFHPSRVAFIIHPYHFMRFL